jgi:hypothetical protein
MMHVGDHASGRALECHLCHRLGSRGFVSWGSEGWECAYDRACARRRSERERIDGRGPAIVGPRTVPAVSD